MKHLILTFFSMMLAGLNLSADRNFQDRKNRIHQEIGSLKNYSFFYNEYGVSDGYTESMSVYCLKNDKKKDLFNLTIADNYLSDVKLLKLQKKDFIYVGTTHTYGHSAGFLYFLNTQQMKTYPVRISGKGSFKLPDSLYVHKSFELSLGENNTFTSSAVIRSKKGSYRGFWEVSYSLKQIKPNVFVLLSGKSSLNETEE